MRVPVLALAPVLVLVLALALVSCRGSAERADETRDAATTAATFPAQTTATEETSRPSTTPPTSGLADPTPEQEALLEQAAEYSLAHEGLTVLVRLRDEVVFESYRSGVTTDDAHNLFSGTKSFNCAIAVAAQAEGLLDLDEEVSATIDEWRDDPDLAAITIRQLLSLSSGIEGGPAGEVPSYARAVAEAHLVEPSAPRFDYGAVPFQVFGEVMKRKLAGSGESMTDYVQRRVFDPIGLTYELWRTTENGDPRMSAGLFLTPRNWSLYGQLIVNGGSWEGRTVLEPDLLARCFEPGVANPGYGLGFWLPTNAGGLTDTGRPSEGAEQLAGVEAPADLVVAAGAGGQRLYVMPSLDLVVVRQADREGGNRDFSNAEFLAPILAALG